MARRLRIPLTLIVTLFAWLLPAPGAVAAPPAAPDPTSPANDAVLEYPAQPPLFRWNDVVGAVSYKLEVDDAPDFIGAASYSTRNTAYVLTEPQTIGQPFYWHVAAVNAASEVSAWSATRSYSIEWPGSKPTLTSPPNASTITDVALVWQPVLGAATYQVQVSPNGDWANNISFDVVVKGTRYSPPATLNNASYFWRVRGRDAATTPNVGQWSDEWQFTRGWSGIPTLTEPADTVATSVETPTLGWTPVDHASHYEIQLGTDPNFSPGTFSSCFTNHTEFTYYELIQSTGPTPPGPCNSTSPRAFHMNPGTVYHWRVRGVDGPTNVNGQWSDVSRFLFRSGDADTVSLIAPADGATVEVPALSWNAVPNIERYRVTLTRSGGATQTVTTSALSWTPTSAFTGGLPATFSWSVQTVDEYDNVGVIGEERTFTLQAPSTTFASPNVLTPSSGSSSRRMPSMTWQPVTGATYYEVWYSVAGAGVESALSGSTNLPFTGFTYTSDPLPPGDYTFRVKAFNSGGLIATGPSSAFTIASPGVVTTYLGPCSSAGVACTVADTPTLRWSSVDQAGLYLVYIALDPNFTNIVKTYETQYTTLTPRESLLDNQAGQSYYWFVRPCVTSIRCGRFDASVHPNAFAFHKDSNAIELETPSSGATVEDLTTFTWEDFLVTNQAAGAATQEARQYRIQVSTVADFASILDEKTVDQTTFTPFDKTYPEGTLYWRVQAIDGSGNALTRSAQWSVVKASPKISLQFPDADVSFVGNLPYLQWTPQAYAAKYQVEVYDNGDLNFSPSNRVLTQITKMSAWAPTTSLDPGTYAWRVRRLDADNRAGPWSNGRKFSLTGGGREPTSTSVSASVRSGTVRVNGSVSPDQPGESMNVTLFRRHEGAWQRLATKHPTIANDGTFRTSFNQPRAMSCKVLARFPGDADSDASRDVVRFRC